MQRFAYCIGTLLQVLIRPVLAYDSETWVLSKYDESSLGIFERKILTAILDLQMTMGNGE